MNVSTTITPFSIQLKHPFGVSGHTRTSTPIVLLQLNYKGYIAYGEASLPPYLGVTQHDVITFLQTINFNFIINNSIQDVHLYLAQQPNVLMPAVCAIDIAWHDLHCKLNNSSIAEHYSIDIANMPQTTFTIGIDAPSTIAQKVQEANDFDLLKIKVGSANDIALLNALKLATNKPFMVDANQGWTNINEAVTLTHWLKANGCYIIEQPFSKLNNSATAQLKQLNILPIIADEAFQQIADLPAIATNYDGVNIKLMKCGGIYPALQIIKEAKKLNLQILLGSMNESSCAILAAAHIAPLCHYADLDGPWLITNNPFKNPTVAQGRIQLSNATGLGLELV
ncbi:MAG: dipeptide epimerase [Bacteroidia bacterium]|nr:dipeptide epimerase [Bacteroidia bacterium]